MVVLLDKGAVVDFDEGNKERWRINDLRMPLDAQYLPGAQMPMRLLRKFKVFAERFHICTRFM